MSPSRHRLLRPLCSALTVLAACTIFVTQPARADTQALRWQVSVDGRDVGTATNNNPMPLHPDRGARIALSVDNAGPSEVTVRSIRLDGRVMGLTFFSFTSRIDLAVAPGHSGQRTVDLDLADLGAEAVGLIPARIALLDGRRQVLDAQSFVADVDGSAGSAYGVFGLVVALITVLLALGLALDLARNRLPTDRWLRATRFLPAGIGLGLTATFTLSATRLLAPNEVIWVPLVLGCAAVAFCLGYISPAPTEEELPFPTAGATLPV